MKLVAPISGVVFTLFVFRAPGVHVLHDWTAPGDSSPGEAGWVLELDEIGWDDRAIWEITALVAFFNLSGRLEAASGLPPDQIPDGAGLSEARDG